MDLINILDRGKRYKAIFLTMLRSNEYVTSDFLASITGVSIRTIKKDLKNLQSEFNENQLNLKIISKKAHGYSLIISNKDLYEQIQKHFQLYQADVQSEFSKRVYLILKMLLASRKPIKIIDLQKQMLINDNNSLNRELLKVKDILKSYQLVLNYSLKGIEIKGPIYFKILLLSRDYKYFGVDVRTDIEYYDQLFIISKSKRAKIRQIIFSALVRSNISFSDVTSERFVNLIVLLHHLEDDVFYQSQLTPYPEFDYKKTREYKFVKIITNNLSEKELGFKYSVSMIEFLTHISVMSIDIYHFQECSTANYGELLDFTIEIRDELIRQISKTIFVDVSNNETLVKDLTKILLPISLKIKWGISDDVNITLYKDPRSLFSPILEESFKHITQNFMKKYTYYFSTREQQVIIGIIQGMINRIELTHRKLDIVIIAINGKLSTQQIKFNLLHYYKSYINVLSTKSLYELKSQDYDYYDYYICGKYGKNMRIPFHPILYVDETIKETEYVDSLQKVFLKSLGYDLKLPKITVEHVSKMTESYENYCATDIYNSNNTIIRVLFNLNSSKNNFKVYRFDQEYQSTDTNISSFIVLDTKVNGDFEMLKMITNIFWQIEKKPSLIQMSSEKKYSYTYFIENN
ncbi:HTH domain-containing protein [Xylocopilactobacillus apis]|nr:HTH domain-containing protein [Xylocopilactobacillus apis]